MATNTGSTGNWSDPTKWSQGHVPANGEDVDLAAGAVMAIDDAARTDLADGRVFALITGNVGGLAYFTMNMASMTGNVTIRATNITALGASGLIRVSGNSSYSLNFFAHLYGHASMYGNAVVSSSNCAINVTVASGYALQAAMQMGAYALYITGAGGAGYAPVTIVGDVGGTSQYGLFDGTTNGIDISITGNCTASAVQGGKSRIVIVGNVGTGAAGFGCIYSTGGAGFTVMVTGNVTAGAYTSIQVASGSVIIVNGNVTGGSANNANGIYCSNSTCTVNGTVQGGSYAGTMGGAVGIICTGTLIINNGSIIHKAAPAFLGIAPTWNPRAQDYAVVAERKCPVQLASRNVRKGTTHGDVVGTLSSGGAFGRFRRIDQ